MAPAAAGPAAAAAAALSAAVPMMARGCFSLAVTLLASSASAVPAAGVAQHPAPGPPPPPPPPPPGDAAKVMVFHGGLANTSCYRIPSIAQTSKGVLVAFAEAREGSCGDGAVHSIAVRRSLDHGKTWGDVSFVKGPGGSMVGNPVAWATKSGKVVLTYVLHSAKCQADCGIGNGVSVSSDDGETWGAPKDVSKMWGPASGSLPGPGNGVQTTTGRLIVAAHHSAYVHDFIVWSDDDGSTWTPASTHATPSILRISIEMAAFSIDFNSNYLKRGLLKRELL